MSGGRDRTSDKVVIITKQGVRWDVGHSSPERAYAQALKIRKDMIERPPDSWVSWEETRVVMDEGGSSEEMIPIFQCQLGEISSVTVLDAGSSMVTDLMDDDDEED